MRIKIKSAFTLVETMVVVLLFALILGGVYTTMLAGNSSWQNHEAAVTVQQEARRAIAYMARDLRTAGNLQVNYSADSLAATFNHPQDGVVRYSWLGKGELAGQILRQDSSGSRVIGKDITAITIVESRRAISFSVTASRVSSRGGKLTFTLAHRVGKR